jgi:hypothetical protein
MNTLSSKLTAFAAALAINGLGLSALGYLFALQSHPNMSAIAFAKGSRCASEALLRLTGPFGLLPSPPGSRSVATSVSQLHSACSAARDFRPGDQARL